MNFLAHIYLSGDDEDLIIGNFIADGIKGKRYLKFPPSVQRGILLHRAIDYYTDNHPIVRESTSRLHKNYGHYSGVIVDILYDHFLAKNWDKYHHLPLEVYVENFYELLLSNIDWLPSRIQKMIPYMIADNWLVSYSTVSGISKILTQMNIRTNRISHMNFAVIELEEYYKEFEYEFSTFFETIQEFAKNKIKEL